jgi:hypothetical protein
VVAGQQQLDRLVDLGRAGERAVGEGGQLEVARPLFGLDEDRIGDSAARLVLPMPGTP